MDNPKNQQHGGPHAAEHRPHHRPIHHSPFFWIGAVLMLAAMTGYVLSNNLSSPRGAKDVPVVVP
jgi:hypothetical protein